MKSEEIAVRPAIAISSDFIVGFPGESERDFAATLALSREVGFDQSFSFLYSRRPGTPAAALPDETEPAVKQQRLARLRSEEHTSELQSPCNLVCRLLLEKKKKNNRRRQTYSDE